MPFPPFFPEREDVSPTEQSPLIKEVASTISVSEGEWPKLLVPGPPAF